MTRQSLICSLVFLVIAFARPGYADEHFPFLAEVSRESVNVRAGPNINFEKVDELRKGDKVVVLGHYYEWYKVQPPSGTKAYIRSDYVDMKGDGVGEVSGDNVNVRSRPTSDAASLGEVKRGTLVKVLGQANGWTVLSPVAGTAMWINQGFLKQVSGEVPEAMLIPQVQLPPAAPPAPVAAPVKAAEPQSPWVSMRGTVEALVTPADPQVHYEIVLDNKSVFLLKDMPQLEYFCNTVVNIEGNVVPDPQKKYMYPLLHINKIVLVL
ncbi:MAG: SH3 domain-containing protein [Candidatus Omnitrophica bacterium]|nr:SH3 domain-containing protein [Candidatus Omnitrophota bacterium]MDE2222641.1 SH3 domain-containing protein [Candidatus Omnitrophota bacterium]